MIDKIIKEATDAVSAAIKGTGDIVGTVTNTVKEQVVNVVSGTGEVELLL